MLSRVANSIYWMSRYIERAENVARFINVNLNLMLDYALEEDGQQWGPLIAASGDTDLFKKKYLVETEENVIRFLTFDKENPNSILSCLSMARENARTVRDTISSEMWENLNNIYLKVKAQSKRPKLVDLHSFYAEVKLAGHLLVGLSESTMSHGEGWHFARMGRLLERADKTARILDVKYFILLPSIDSVDTPLDSIVWGALLKSISAFEMYRKRFNRIYYKDVIDFLLFDPEFPRSVRYCIEVAQKSLKTIVDEMETELPAVFELRQLQESITKTNIDNITQAGLHQFIDMFQFNLNIVGNEIHNSFFALRPGDSLQEQ